MTPETVMVIVDAALLCAALALAVALPAAIASLVAVLAARIPSMGEHAQDESRHATAPAGNVPGQRA